MCVAWWTVDSTVHPTERRPGSEDLRVVGELKCTYNAYYLLSILGALSVKTRHHKPPLRGGPPQAGEARHTRESGRRGAGGGAARSRVVVPACNCTLVYCVRENSF